jgi:hypothetical protein
MMDLNQDQYMMAEGSMLASNELDAFGAGMYWPQHL